MRRDTAHKNNAEKDKLLFQKHPVVLQSVRVHAMLVLCLHSQQSRCVSAVDALLVCFGKAGLTTVACMCCYARWDEINTGLVIVD